MTNTATIQALREKANTTDFEPSTTWMPAAGEELFGVLESIADVETKIGKTRVARIRTEAGSLVAVFLTRSVLRSKFEALNPAVGQTLYFRYDGQRTSENGRTYHAYGVSCL